MPQHDGERVPLFSLEAEASVLSAVMQQPDAWESLVEVIPNEEMFYQPAHREVYRAMVALRDAGESFGMVQITNALRNTHSLERAGGTVYLAELFGYTYTAANLASDARIVRDKHQLRRLNTIGRDVAALAETGRPVAEVQEEAERLIYAAGEGLQVDAPLKHIKAGLLAALDRLEKNEPDVLTGFADYDRMSNGFARGDLVILAARPSMGKTALMLQIAVNVAIREKKPVPVFSLEMSEESIAKRLLFCEARVSPSDYRRKPDDPDMNRRLHDAVCLLNQTPVFTHSSARTVREVRAQCRRLVAQHGPLGLIAIDYLGKMRGSGQAEKRVHELGEITGDLKALGVEFDAPVLLLSQLSRAVEARPDKRPMMSDLRDSGEIEQDADTVLLLYRPEYYFGPTMKVGEGKGKSEVVSIEGKAELLVSKQRNGETGSVPLHFHKEFTRFESISDREQPR